MKISTEIASCARIVGEEKAVELVAKAGFDGWDLSLFQMCKYNWSTKQLEQSDHPFAGAEAINFTKHLAQIAKDNGIVCNQSHAPFPVSCKGVCDKLKLAIECTAVAGGEICIIHPDNDKSAEQNAEMYNELLPFAKECKVKIATENMWNWDNEKDQSSFAACATAKSFNDHLDAVNDEYLVACLDIGHAEMKGNDTSAAQMIKALGSRLKALHIHDNDKWHDTHQIPFSMQIDFTSVARALKEIGYNGYFTLEADRYLSAFNKDNVFDGVKDLALSAKRFVQLYKNS
ncbi:MAG: sugar phosphate isomerase/epimerase [Clostridia bacterium]|nr:sugar phosphate isomerase/epimerase [Clostridia bacterium]